MGGRFFWESASYRRDLGQGQELAQRLAQSIPDNGDARTVAESAGLDPSRLDTSGSPHRAWDNILDEAARVGKLEALCAKARERAGNESLKKAIAAIDALPDKELRPASTPPRDPPDRRRLVLVVATIGAALCGTIVLAVVLRQPTRWYRGTLKGPDGSLASHASVVLVGTACKVETNDDGYFDMSGCAREKLSDPRVHITLADGTVCDDARLEVMDGELQLGADRCEPPVPVGRASGSRPPKPPTWVPKTFGSAARPP